MPRVPLPFRRLRTGCIVALCLVGSVASAYWPCPLAALVEKHGTPRVQAEVDAAVEEAFAALQRRSARLKGEIRRDNAANRPHVVDMVVVGGGNQSAQFVEGYRSERPKDKVLIFEATGALGTFHRLAGSFDMNTPENQAFSGNTFPGMPIQSRDIHLDGKKYPSATLAGQLTVLAHHYLKSNVLFNERALPYEEMPAGANWPARYRVRTESGLVVYTHAVALGTGMGRPKVDHLAPASLDLVHQEVEALAGARAKKDFAYTAGIQVGDDFLETAARDRAAGKDPMARYGNGTIAFIGAAHGSFTAVEAATGLNHELNPSGTPNRKNPILWFNQKATDEAQFRSQFKPPDDPALQDFNERYGQIGGVYNWQLDGKKEKVLTPVSSHVTRIEKFFPDGNGGRPKYRIYYQASPGQTGEPFQVADYVVMATGYQSEVPALTSQAPGAKLAPVQGDWTFYRNYDQLPPVAHLGYQVEVEGKAQPVYVLPTALGGKLQVPNEELPLLRGAFIDALAPRSSALGAFAGRAAPGPVAAAKTDSPLTKSPYEKFHSRVPLRASAELPRTPTAARLDAQVELARLLRDFQFAEGARPQIVMDADSGDLAVEVSGLDRPSAERLAAKLRGSAALHKAVEALAGHGVRRTRIDLPVPPTGGRVRIDRMQVAFQAGGPPASVEKRFAHDGRPYREYQYTPGAANNHQFKELVDHSVEVLYMPKGPWGHLAVRVGNRYYSYGMVKNFVNREFLPFPGATGYGFRVPPEKVREVIRAMDKATANGTKYNVPPYDVYATRLELVQTPGGGLRYRSDTPDSMKSGDAIIRNNEPLNAKLVQSAGKTFLETPEGFRWPVQVADGKMYVESINCVNSVRYVLGQFGLQLGLEPVFPKTVTDSVDRLLKPGNIGGSPPDFVVNYPSEKGGN